MGTTLFLSYRRADSAGFARALYDWLCRHVAPDKLFIDVAAVAPGEDFARVAEDRIAQSDLFLLLIGPTWLTAANSAGRRLDDPDDLVRVEVETALRHGVRIVPILIDGAAMPSAADLPPSLRAITRYNAVLISHVHFDADAQALLRLLETPRALFRSGVLAAACLMAIAVAAWYAAHPTAAPFRTALAALASVGAGIALVGALRAFRPELRLRRAHRLVGAGLAAILLAFLTLSTLRFATAPFDLTVRLAAPPLAPPVRGDVALRYGQTERTARVEAASVVVFSDVPGRYRDALVVTPHLGGFVARADSVGPLPSSALYTLHLERAVYQTHVRGTVVDARGEPLPGVVLDFGSGLATATTDTLGRFGVEVPREAGTSVMVRASQHGTLGYNDLVTLSPTVALRLSFDPL